MWDLIYLEIRRVYKSRFTIAVFIGLIIIIGFIIRMFYIDNLPIHEYVNSNGVIDEGFINEVIDEKKILINDEEHYTNGRIINSYYTEFDNKYNEVHDLIAFVLTPGYYTETSNVENSGYLSEEGFYSRWETKQREILETEYTYGNYSDEEIEFFWHRVTEFDFPFEYTGNKGWKIAIRLVAIIALLVGILNCIIIAPIVSYDYQNRVDLLILTSKYGRHMASKAKIITVFIISVINFVFAFAVFSSVMAFLYGTKGGGDSIAVWIHKTPYDWTNMGAYLFVALVGQLGIIVLGQMTLLISIYSRWIYITIAISMGLTIFPKFIQHSRDSRLVNYLVDILPTNLTDGYSAICDYKCYKLVNQLILQGWMKLWISILLICILMLLSSYSYSKRTLKN